MEEINTVEFEVKETREVKFGNNKFLEIALKIAKTETGETEFVSISKGFVGRNGQKQFNKSLGFPAEKEIRDALVQALQEIM